MEIRISDSPQPPFPQPPQPLQPQRAQVQTPMIYVYEQQAYAACPSSISATALSKSHKKKRVSV
jgi:hypothetical protein